MADSISRMAKTSVPGVINYPVVCSCSHPNEVRFASQSFTTMTSAKRWQGLLLWVLKMAVWVFTGVRCASAEVLRRAVRSLPLHKPLSVLLSPVIAR